MKKGFIFTVMLVSVLALSYSQSTLSGTYRYSTNAYVTFTGNAFTGSWNATSPISGTYSVSGSRLTLNITGGPKSPDTWGWTIVDANTLRDQDGDRWNKEGTGSSSPVQASVQPPISWNVNNVADWIEAVNGIRNGGNNKNHSIKINGNIDMLVTPASEYTFGSVTGITVTMEGNGTISTSTNGSLIQIGNRQTLIIKDLTLKGRNDNNARVIQIWNGGTFRMVGNSTITGNSVSGVLIVEGTFAMQDNASVSGNSTRENGGGVSVFGGTFTMQDNTSVSNNNSRWSSNGGGGGGVYIEGGTFTMSGSATVTNNTCFSGGGGVLVKGGTFTMQGSSTISNNTCDSDASNGGWGGGVGISGNVTFRMLDNSKVSGNTASHGGGGISGDVIMRDSATVSGNNAKGAWSSGGGGIDGTVTMSGNAKVYGNTSGCNGGGVSGTLTMQDNTSVTGNTANNGGGVFGTLTMNGNASVSGNIAVSANKDGGGNGGGVVGNITMQGGTISGNVAGGVGGGVLVGRVERRYGWFGDWEVSKQGTFSKNGGTIYGNNETDENLKNTARQGSAIYQASPNLWRNVTAGPTMNPNSFGFWLND